MTSPDVFENAAVKHNVPSGPSYNKSEKRLQEKARVHHYNGKIWHAHNAIASIVRISHVSIPVAETARKKLS